jgi:hypothetical protein
VVVVVAPGCQVAVAVAVGQAVLGCIPLHHTPTATALARPVMDSAASRHSNSSISSRINSSSNNSSTPGIRNDPRSSPLAQLVAPWARPDQCHPVPH